MMWIELKILIITVHRHWDSATFHH